MSGVAVAIGGAALIGGGVSVYNSSKNRKAAGGSDGVIRTQEILDPSKQAVATPLSKFLASNIGKGASPYPGQVSTDLDPEAQSAYSDFLGLDAGDWYSEAVSKPAWKEWREEAVPLISEGYAGALRGSGRYRSVEDSGTKLASSLAQGRYQAEREIPEQQFKMGLALQQTETAQKALEYQEWIRTQPEYSPAISQALAFLSKSTSSGSDTLAGMSPGTAGWLPALLGTAISATGSYLGNKAIANASANNAATSGINAGGGVGNTAYAPGY